VGTRPTRQEQVRRETAAARAPKNQPCTVASPTSPGQRAGALANTKGINFVNVKAFCDERFGHGAWARVLHAMCADDRAALALVAPEGWHDLALYARLIRTLDATLGRGDLGLIQPLGRYQADRDLSGVFRLVFRFASPIRAVEEASRYWDAMHDSGVWHLRRESDSVVSGVLEGWGVVDRALCLELGGYMPRVIELSGGNDARMIHPKCRANGEASCYFEMSWSV
jgi:hypothetical protein